MSTLGKPESTYVRPTSGLSAGIRSTLIAMLLLGIAAVIAIAVVNARSGAGAQTYPVTETVAAHAMSSTAVADKVIARLVSMGSPGSQARIVKMTVTTGADAVRYETRAGRPPANSRDASAVVWVVRAEGAFVGLRIPPGADPIVSPTGYFIVDDATGEIIEMGMP